MGLEASSWTLFLILNRPYSKKKMSWELEFLSCFEFKSQHSLQHWVRTPSALCDHFVIPMQHHVCDDLWCSITRYVTIGHQQQQKNDRKGHRGTGVEIKLRISPNWKDLLSNKDLPESLPMLPTWKEGNHEYYALCLFLCFAFLFGFGFGSHMSVHSKITPGRAGEPDVMKDIEPRLATATCKTSVFSTVLSHWPLLFFFQKLDMMVCEKNETKTKSNLTLVSSLI